MRSLSVALKVVQSGSPYMKRVRAGEAVPPGRLREAREEAEGGEDVDAAADEEEEEEKLEAGVDAVRVREVVRRMRVVREGILFIDGFFD